MSINRTNREVSGPVAKLVEMLLAQKAKDAK